MTDTAATTEDALASTSTEVLEHECVTLAAEVAAMTCRWLLVIAELDRRKIWADWGCRSMAHYVSYRCSMALRTARDHVRVATALGGLPVMTAAFGRGELTYSKVRALTRVAEVTNEIELVELARTATASQLDRMIAASIAVTADPVEVAERRDVYTVHRADGLAELRIVCRPEELEQIQSAITTATPRTDGSAEPHEDGSAEPSQTAGGRRVEGVLRIAESYLANGDGCRDGSASTHVVVHVDLDRDTGEITSAETESGVPLHPETASRLSCDSTLFTIVHDKLVPLGHGLARRNPSRKLRRAIRRRSKGVCEWPGCQERTYVQLHHIQHWTDNGPTEWWNLAALCWHHHHLVHEGGWSITFDHAAETMHVWRPDGTCWRRHRRAVTPSRGG